MNESINQPEMSSNSAYTDTYLIILQNCNFIEPIKCHILCIRNSNLNERDQMDIWRRKTNKLELLCCQLITHLHI